MQIGLAGVGRMGVGIAARLMEVGHQVTVGNRPAEQLNPIAPAGAKVAKTPAELAGASEIIITILTDAAAIDAVYGGPDGLLAGDVRGKLFIEMRTVQPGTELARPASGLRRLPGWRPPRPGAAAPPERASRPRAGRRRTGGATVAPDVPPPRALRA